MAQNQADLTEEFLVDEGEEAQNQADPTEEFFVDEVEDEFNAFLAQVEIEQNWTKALAKGSTLHELMQLTTEQANALYPSLSRPCAVFTYADIHNSGYTIEVADDYYMDVIDSEIHALLHALETSGFDPDINKGRIGIGYRHDLFQDDDTSLYTGGYFNQVINPYTGAIIAFDNASPSKMATANCEIPALRHWSDAVYLQWKITTPEDCNLRYVLRANIENKATLKVVNKALKGDLGDERLKWPGVRFAAESVEGKALLGTPNGSGVGYLLGQYKEELGHKAVKWVTVFREDQRHKESLLFWIEEVKAEEKKDEAKEG